MELQTVVKIEQPAFRIDYSSRLMMLGSCFVENIGAKLESLRFQVDINPCGIVYNPLSVADSLELLLDNRRFTETDLLQNGGKWVSLHHHGHFSADEAETCLQKINDRLTVSAEHLRHTDVLILTWGTSWVYRYKASGQVVANCHKLPASAFERFRLEAEDIVTTYTALIRRLLLMRPGLQIVFTVSPVRHWKDGAHGNQLSKAVLLLAIEKLQQTIKQVSYFPAYEIVMDELRDYRFYADDLLHISSQGVEYIWEKFCALYFSEETRALMKQVEKINKKLSHRPFHPDPEALRRLREEAEQELKALGFQL